MTLILETVAGPIRSATYLTSTPEHVLWGRLPCGADDATLSVEPGTEVTTDTISRDGILQDQDQDFAPVERGMR